jgi:hypothetical protein
MIRRYVYIMLPSFARPVNPTWFELYLRNRPLIFSRINNLHSCTKCVLNCELLIVGLNQLFYCLTTFTDIKLREI